MLFTRKLNVVTDVAGLLAWLAVEHLPIPAGQWYEVSTATKHGFVVTPYSYGDSAGFAPDFPFNSAGAETRSGQM